MCECVLHSDADLMLKKILSKVKEREGNVRTVNMITVNVLRHIHIRSIHVVIYSEQVVCSGHPCSTQMLETDISVRKKLLGITDKI